MLKELLKEFNLTNNQLTKLNKMREICLSFNQHTNLTSIKDEKEFNIKHILDSLSILKFHNLDGKKILDVGSGGGFPGLVLAIVLEKSNIVMLDSNNKKIKYIQFAIEELSLKNATTIYARVEEANIRESFDIVVSRAVAPMNILLEILSFASKIGGKIILLKGNNLDKEMPSDWKKISDLGISFDVNKSFILENNIERKIISFCKTKETNKNYPRSFSIIKSNPIY